MAILLMQKANFDCIANVMLTNYEILLMKWIFPTFNVVEFDAATHSRSTNKSLN